MSHDNPFASPVIQNPNPAYAKNRESLPGITMTILIFTLILGILGISMSCLSGVGLAMQSSINQFSLPPEDSEEHEKILEMQKKMEEVQRQQFVPNMIVIVANAIVAPLLIIASIGGLTRKQWGLSLLLISYVAAMIYKLGGFIIHAWVQLSTKDKMVEAMAEMSPNAESAEIIGSMMGVWLVAAVVIAGLFSLALFIFYFCAYRHFSNPKTQAFYS